MDEEYPHGKIITQWLEPNEIIETEYGYIKAKKWLRFEKLRIPGTVIETSSERKIALIKL